MTNEELVQVVNSKPVYKTCDSDRINLEVDLNALVEQGYKVLNIVGYSETSWCSAQDKDVENVGFTIIAMRYE